MMLTIFLCVMTISWYAVFRYRRRRMYELASKIKSSKYEDLPMLGLTRSLMGSTEEIMASLQRFSRECMREDMDGWLRGWLGHILYFICINLVDLEVVLKNCLEKDDLHRFIRNVIGNGGIFAPVSIWRRRRKILVPAFSPKTLENFVEVFSEQSEKLAKRLENCAGTGQFSVWPYLSTYTLDSVCETALGVQMNTQSNPDSSFLKHMNRVLNLVCQRIFHLWLQPNWLYQCFPRARDHDTSISMMQDFTDEVIRKKREEMQIEEQQKTESDLHYDLGSYKKKTFLDLLISFSGGERGYTNTELREEVLTLTVAGTDTSAVAAGYTLKLLAKYPKVQEKVYQELNEVFGDSERPLVKEDLMKLPYLERVVKESLRLFPPVPFVIRKVEKEIHLPSGKLIPANSGIVVSIWGLHRDPAHWGPDADHFDPDRFLPERFNLKHSCSFMPFSSGPRNCVGYQYALMSVKTVLSAIVRRFKVVGDVEESPAPYIRVKLDIMMKAVDGYQIGLEKRKPCQL